MNTRPYQWPALLLIKIALCLPLHAQVGSTEDGGTPPGSAPEAAAATNETVSEGPAQADTPLGPQLSPFYEHYVRSEDGTRVRNFLYLYSTTSNPDGSASRRLLPFFYHAKKTEPPTTNLHLYPLLYFHKESPEETYNYALPFFYDRRTDSSSFQLLFPLWFHTTQEEKKISQHHVLFPFWRHTTDVRDEQQPVRSLRTGLWGVMDLWQSRTTPTRRDRTALNFFNWGEDAQGGLSLYSSSWIGSGADERGSTRLFPFYWHAREPGWENRVGFPFYWQGSGLRSKHLWIAPLFGYWSGPDRYDFWLLPLLSGFGRGPEDASRFWLPFPLFHYSRSPERLAVWSPLYGHTREKKVSTHHALLYLYYQKHDLETGKRSYSLLYPLSHLSRDPTKGTGASWFLPYYERFNRKRLWRFVLPLYIEKQNFTEGGETDSFFRTTLPLYYSWGSPRDYFSMGFPLYWAKRKGKRGWNCLAPLFLYSYSATAHGFHIPMVFSYRSFPSRKQLSIGGPLYIHERTYDFDETPTGSTRYLLWPLTGMSRTQDGYHYRLLPLFWISREKEASDLLLTPLYYQQSSSTETRRYLFPLYGRYESQSLTRQYYAGGTYIHSLRHDEHGVTVGRSNEFLWKLLAFENELHAQKSHQHVLPLAFWNTRSPPVDRRVIGPLYYSHRIREGSREHRLKMVLGNAFYSKTIEESAPVKNKPLDPVGPGSDAASVEEAETPPEGLFPIAVNPADSGARSPGRIVESDTGILWPLTRSYYSEKQEASGNWLAPFYFNVENRFGTNFALWPLQFRQNDYLNYDPSYYRYFFLSNWETWKGGYRLTLGQLLFDWKRDVQRSALRLRLLFPFFEYDRNPGGWQVDVLSPLFTWGSNTDQGEAVMRRRLFPFFWQGSRDRQTATGEWQPEERYFFLLPFFGVHARTTRTDYRVLFPLFHLLKSNEGINFELWPSLFYRNQPGFKATRVWPVHAHETGEIAGDFWVSRYLFPSKYFRKNERTEYRLDPFLYSSVKTPQGHRSSALFNLYVNRKAEDESWFHLFPLAFGGSEGNDSFFTLPLLHYRRNFGDEDIDYLIPWRFFSLSNHLQGANGERHTGILGKLFEHTDNVNEPEFHETRFMHMLYINRETATSKQLTVNPFFNYRRDEQEDDFEISFLLSLYKYRNNQGLRQHTLFYFLKF